MYSQLAHQDHASSCLTAFPKNASRTRQLAHRLPNGAVGTAPASSAMSTMSPVSSHMRATSTPAGKRPPPLLRMSRTYLHVRRLKHRTRTQIAGGPSLEHHYTGVSYCKAVTGMAGRCGRKHERQGKPEIAQLLLQPSSGPCQAPQAETHPDVPEMWGAMRGSQ